MSRSFLSKLMSSVDNELKSISSGDIIILGDFNTFKATIEASTGTKISIAKAKKAYSAAKAAASAIEGNFLRRDPLKTKIIKSSLMDTPYEKSSYVVSSSKHGARTVKSAITASLIENGVLEDKKGMAEFKVTASDSIISDLQSNLGTFLQEAHVSSKTSNVVNSLLLEYSEALKAGGVLKAKFILTAITEGVDSPIVRRTFNKFIATHSPELLSPDKANSLGDKVSASVESAFTRKAPKTKPRTSVSSIAGKRTKPKVTKKPTPGLKRNSGKNLSVLALLNALNRQLPKVIRKNMGTPRLNWRTGRFGTTVRALSVEPTSNDSATITYSYMGWPYRLFEPGNSGLATPMRDPRKLIDLSIREIAISMTTAKFTTRRRFS